MVAGLSAVMEVSKVTMRCLAEDLEFQPNDGMERSVIGGVCLCFWFARGAASSQ